ncbi:hypothetical protein [Acuticoccus kandeliae]|uniref:hypothetical protein n=1 Tax=Acuticoccus kandeliae TaxID=2073160 RepID=UPI0013007C68|nr:hypothetical protein [Acuticoccus kandeliae]
MIDPTEDNLKTITDAIDQPDESAETLAEVKPRLLVDRASPDIVVSNLRDVLAMAGGLYDRGAVVRLYPDAVQGGTRVRVLDGGDLILHAHSKCRPYAIRTNREGEREVDVQLPKPIAEMYLGWNGALNLPILNGITRAPVLREDGSIHAAVGYDARSGLWCENVPDVADLVPERPTIADARAALRHIRELFRTFCFSDAKVLRDARGGEVVDIESPPGADESAFLAALLTAVCRASLTLAPGCLIGAASMSGAGAGKGLLVRCICQIAFGQEPHAVSGGSGQEELEKRIAAELIEASPALFLDNLNNRTLKSDLLASVLTERPARIRLLGRSQMVPLNSSTFVVLTGNGLGLAEDLVRRFLIIELDPRTENPELRSFQTDIKAICHDKRREILAAVLTIWRWGRCSKDELPAGLPIGSFETWSSWVRDPLVALGCQDPVARIAETKTRDTQRAEITELFSLWNTHHGESVVSQRNLAAPVIDALDPLGRGRQYQAKRLASLTGTRMSGYVLVRQAGAGKHGVAVYALQKSEEAETHRGHRGHTASNGSDDPDDPDATTEPRLESTCSYRPGPGGAGRWHIEEFTQQGSQAPETHRGHRGHPLRDPYGSSTPSAAPTNTRSEAPVGPNTSISSFTAVPSPAAVTDPRDFAAATNETGIASADQNDDRALDSGGAA